MAAKKNDKPVKEHRASVRFTDEEWILLHENQAEAGIKSRAAFLEKLILEGLEKQASREITESPAWEERKLFDPEMYHQVRRIGVNLNQITHRINDNPYQDMPPQLQEALREVRLLMQRLGSALDWS